MPVNLEKPAVRPEGRLARRPTMDELFNTMLGELERFWESPFGLWTRAPARAETPEGAEIEWMPRLDVVREKGELVVRVDLPGMTKEDLDIRIEDKGLVLTGERRLETEKHERETWRLERMHGTFYRRVPLGFDVDPEKVAARFDNGVLELRLPVPEEKLPEPKRIRIG